MDLDLNKSLFLIVEELRKGQVFVFSSPKQDEIITLLQKIVSNIPGILVSYCGNFVTFKNLSRAEQSMQPWDLSEEDAAFILKALEQGLAKPKIPITPLPEYQCPKTSSEKKNEPPSVTE